MSLHVPIDVPGRLIMLDVKQFGFGVQTPYHTPLIAVSIPVKPLLHKHLGFPDEYCGHSLIEQLNVGIFQPVVRHVSNPLPVGRYPGWHCTLQDLFTGNELPVHVPNPELAGLRMAFTLHTELPLWDKTPEIFSVHWRKTPIKKINVTILQIAGNQFCSHTN